MSALPMLLVYDAPVMTFQMPNGDVWAYWVDATIYRDFLRTARKAPGKAFQYVKQFARRAEPVEFRRESEREANSASRQNPISYDDALVNWRKLGGGELTKAEYRRLARVHHTDRAGSQENIAALTEAWNALSASASRQAESAGPNYRTRKAHSTYRENAQPDLDEWLRAHPEAPSVAASSSYSRHNGLVDLYQDATRPIYHPANQFFKDKADFALRHWRDPGFRAAYFKQFDPHCFQRGIERMDFTPSTFDERLLAFRNRWEPENPTGWIEVDGEVVFGNKPVSCRTKGRGHTYGSFEGPSHRRCAICGELTAVDPYDY